MDANVALGRRLNADVLAFVLYALLLDIAIETFWSGSPVRWWVVGTVVAYLAICGFVRWREEKVPENLRPVAGPTASLLVILGLLAATAWMSGGLTEGVHAFRQPTSTVLAALVAAGVALCGIALVGWRTLPRAARIGIAVVAAYCAVAFAVGAIAGTPFPALVAGRSLWQRLPMVLQGAFIGGFIILPVGLIFMVVRAGLRRPMETSVRAETWKVAAIAASLAIVLAGMPLRPTAPSSLSSAESVTSMLGIDPNAPKLLPAALNAALANSLKAVEDGEGEMARDRWDPAYVANALGYDPQRVFLFVQNETFWIPYRGLMRGPVGVLMDRLGNSLDRAGLLALLLSQANQTVRLAHGSLSREQAMELLPTLLIARYQATASSEEQDSGNVASVAAQYQLDEASVRRTLTALSDSLASKRAQLIERVTDQTNRLLSAINPHSIDPTGAIFNRTLQALQDHWWVQVLDGGTWRDFDLLARSAGTGLTNPNETVELTAIPAELRHQVTLRVIAEQWNSGALTEHKALEHVLPLANLIGVPVVLRFAPEKSPGVFPPANMTVEQGLRAFALDQHEWTPILMVGQTPAAQSTIHETGDLIQGNAANASPAAGAMTGLTKKFDEAFGEPVTAPPQSKPDSSKVLTSAWIEYEIRSPGEPLRKIHRTLFDLVGPAARTKVPVAAPKIDERAAISRSFALMMETEILPIVSRFAPEYVTHLAAEAVLSNRDLLNEVARGDLTDNFSHAQQVANRLRPMPSSLYALALSRFEWSRFGRDIYVDTPNILTRHTFFAPAPTGFKLVAATDVVANEIGVDLLAGNPFEVRLEQGVLDTNAEAILATARPNPANAGGAYAGADGWVTLASPRDPQLAKLQLSDDVRQRIATDLAAGYAVIAPKAPVSVGTEAFSGWWRIDPATGQTLGMGSTGWGSNFLEWLITRIPAMIVGAGLGYVFEYMLCLLVEPRFTQSPVALSDYFEVPVHAADSGCLGRALWSALLGAALGAFGPHGGKGGKPTGGKADAKTPADPSVNTSPGSPGGEPGAPGAPSSPGAGGPGGGAPGEPPPVQPDTGPPKKFDPETIKKLDELGRQINEIFPKRGAYSELYQQLTKMQNQVTKEALKKLYPEFHSEPPAFGGGNSPTPGTGGASPPTGPGGTQIIPPATSPTAPTLPGTGPGGTQIIPPGPTAPTQQMICPGPGCPPSPYEKTLTGLGGLLNTLGQSSQQ